MRNFLLAIVAFIAQAQTAAGPSFEVASLKLTEHGRDATGWSHSSLHQAPGNLAATNESLQGLIQFAYNVNQYQIVAPEWLSSDNASYDIVAKAPPDTTLDQMRQMMQTLLTERLNLAVHKETRTRSGYDLVVAKNGPRQLQASPDGVRGGTNSTGGQVTATHTSMEELARNLSRWLKEPVFDKTGLQGNFDFKLDYEPDPSQETGTHPSIFTALQQQLGLKLEAAKVPMEMIVVDHAERIPAEN